MKILNLVYPEKSDIKYKISKFPDGQQQVTILSNDGTGKGYGDVRTLRDEEIKINSRLNNFQDLELIICATKSLRELGVQEIHLYTPYFLGSRSDRKFEEGSNNYLKDVICPIINSLNFESVTVLDPHSLALEACINNLKYLTNNGIGSNLISFAFKDLVNKLDKNIKAKTPVEALFNNIILISPDAGATHKIHKLAEQIGYKGDIITCSKERDSEGKLTRCVVPIKGNQHQKDLIIIDDICDGGRTFINIVQEIRRQQESFKTPPNKIYLIVTHGIFSAGFEELSKYFDDIYCTNSYSDIQSMGTSTSMKWLKQLNIF